MKSIGAMALAALLIGSGAAYGDGIVTSSFQSDAAAQALFTEVGFVAEGRFGDSSANATHETGVGSNSGGAASGNFTTSNLTWSSGAEVGFTLLFNGQMAGFQIGNDDDSRVTYNFGSNAFDASSFNALALRLLSNPQGNASNVWSVTLSDLKLSDIGVNGPGPATSVPGTVTVADGAEWLVIRNFAGGFHDGFSLTGKAVLSWTGNAPTNSNLAFQIKGGSFENPVPEPGTIALVAMGAATLAVRRKRRR